MRYPFFPVILFAAQFPLIATAEIHSSALLSDWRPYLELQTWEASDAVAVKKFESDWSTGFSPKGGHNVTLQRLRAGIGVEKDGWSIGWEARQEASLTAERETLEMVRLYKQRLDPSTDTRFNAQARFESWSAQGLRLAHRFEGQAAAGHVPRLTLSAAVYAKPQLRENDVSGTVNYRQGGSYSFNAAQTDAYSRYRYSYPPMRGEPKASGASISALLDWPLADSLSLRLKFDDLWSRIRWSNLPVMQRTVNSDISDRDSNGYVNYRPTLSGMNSQVDRSFSIPRSTTASLSYRLDAWDVAMQIERWSGVTIPTLAVNRHFQWGELNASVETRFNTVGLGVAFGKFRLLVQSDNLHPDRAKALGLQVNYCIANQ